MSRVDRNKNEENRPSSSGGDRRTVKNVLSYRHTYGIVELSSTISKNSWPKSCIKYVFRSTEVSS